jgi:hypothetical protein
MAEIVRTAMLVYGVMSIMKEKKETKECMMHLASEPVWREARKCVYLLFYHIYCWLYIFVLYESLVLLVVAHLRDPENTVVDSLQHKVDLFVELLKVRITNCISVAFLL